MGITSYDMCTIALHDQPISYRRLSASEDPLVQAAGEAVRRLNLGPMDNDKESLLIAMHMQLMSDAVQEHEKEDIRRFLQSYALSVSFTALPAAISITSSFLTSVASTRATLKNSYDSLDAFGNTEIEGKAGSSSCSVTQEGQFNAIGGDKQNGRTTTTFVKAQGSLISSLESQRRRRYES